VPSPYSMTGFALTTLELPEGSVVVELRAVNSRFLDLVFKLGEDFRALEPQLRERIGDQVKRGKLECRINFNSNRESALGGALNPAVLASLARLATEVRQALPDAAPLQVGEVLRWPGLLGESGPDNASLQAGALQLVDAALREFNASRAREGEKLKALIGERLTRMRAHVAELRPKTPAIVAAFREKLGKRLAELGPAADSERLHQEVVLFAQKIDVDEELDRLLSHLSEVERVLAGRGAAGKRLDFLMQELHREANTLGSKSASLELSQASVELKVLIEQMREQVQNIE